MKKYKVVDIMEYFDIFLDDEIEAEDEIEAKEQVMFAICDNIGNYLDIEVVEEEMDK